MSQPGQEAPLQMQLLQMMMGHWVAQVTATIAKLSIPDHLANGERSSDEVAKLCEANPDATHRLLCAAAMLGLFAESNTGKFSLTPLGACLRTGTPGSMRDILVAELAPGHWLPWGRLYDAVKTGQPTAQATLGMNAWEYYGKHPEEAAFFARGMSNLSAMVSDEVLATDYDFSPYANIVDVGGSQGVMLAGILRRASRAKGVLFDRADVIEAGRGAVKAYGLGERISQVAGDFLKDVSSGGDLYVLKSILHDWDDEKSVTILKNIHRAAKPGAKLAVIEMVKQERVTPSPVYMMDLNMLVMLGGRERGEKEFAQLFARGGFTLTKTVPTQGLFSLLEATRS